MGSIEPNYHSGAGFDKSLCTRISCNTKNLVSLFKTNVFWGLTRTHGFTLAEVLITLGIIGIVAAMTMPTIIQKHQEKVIVNKLKKTYSILQQAQLGIIQEYGTMNNIITSNTSLGDGKYNFSNTESVKNIFAKYLKVTENCKTGDNCLGKPVHYINGTLQSTYRDPALILADGTRIFFGYTFKNCSKALTCIDVGIALPTKNRYYTKGRDIFYFNVLSDRIVPTGLQQGNIDSRCLNDGNTCTSWVIFNENMDYLHCKDLNWETKKKCK